MSENYKIVTAEEWKAMFALSKAASECADGTCGVAGGLLIGASLWYNHKALTGGEQWSSSKWAKFLDEQ